MSAQAFGEGDRVAVRVSMGRWRQGTVVTSWAPGDAGGVSVRFDGKVKPRQVEAGKLTRATTAPGVQLVERGPAPPPRTTRAASAPARVVLADVPALERGQGLRPVPKAAGPYRSADYLAFVRSHPCCGCGRREDVEAHHWAERARGKGQKAPDTRTVPLCVLCHERVHSSGALPGMTPLLTKLRFLTVQIELLEEDKLRREAA